MPLGEMPPFDPRPFGLGLSLQSPPLVPELRLWLLAEDIDLEAACEGLARHQAPPYWAFCWGSGQALARFLFDAPGQVAGRHVVDFGSGSGVVAIAAALCGAARVDAVDLDADARSAIEANARSNGVRVRVSSVLPERCDLLIAADVHYESGAWEAFERYAGAREAFLLGEPERPGARSVRGEALARYAVRTHPDVDSPTRYARVFRREATSAGARFD